MAWSLNRIETHVRLIDSGNNETRKIYVMQTISYAQALTDALSIIALLTAVSDAEFVQYDVRSIYANTWSTPADPSIQIEARAVIVGEDDTTPTKRHSIEIPSPSDNVFLATIGEGQNIVDIADPSVLAYFNLFIFGGLAYTSDGEFFQEDAIIKGRRRTVKSGRG